MNEWIDGRVDEEKKGKVSALKFMRMKKKEIKKKIEEIYDVD